MRLNYFYVLIGPIVMMHAVEVMNRAKTYILCIYHFQFWILCIYRIKFWSAVNIIVAPPLTRNWKKISTTYHSPPTPTSSYYLRQGTNGHGRSIFGNHKFRLRSDLNFCWRVGKPLIVLRFQAYFFLFKSFQFFSWFISATPRTLI